MGRAHAGRSALAACRSTLTKLPGAAGRSAGAVTLSSFSSSGRSFTVHDDGLDPDTEREPVWLVCEWEDGAVQPTKFYFAAVPPTLKKRRLVRLLKQRWRTERVYEDLKGELGLDHFEGRRFPGWHHHVSVALCCYAFVVAERVRRFPPSARRQEAHRSLDLAA